MNKTVKWFRNEAKLSEIYQSFEMKFALANILDDQIVQCHDWVKCRDFLHDVVRTSLTGTKTSIYNFVFDKELNPEINLSSINLLVTKNNIEKAREFRIILNNALKLINHYENMVGEELSHIIKVNSDIMNKYKHVWFITGPKFWLSTPYLLSLYTLLLRLGNANIKIKGKSKLSEIFDNFLKLNKKNYKDNDIGYLENIWSNIETLLINHTEISNLNKNNFSKLYFDKISISDFHNNTGIVSACTAKTWSSIFNKKIENLTKKEGI